MPLTPVRQQSYFTKYEQQKRQARIKKNINLYRSSGAVSEHKLAFTPGVQNRHIVLSNAQRQERNYVKTVNGSKI